MTPGEIAGVVGAILAVGALAERVVLRLSAPSAPPRETVVPPAPSQPSLPGLHSCDCCAELKGTVAEQGREIRGAREALVRIRTILEERQDRRARRREEKDDGGTRESGG